MVHRCAGRRLTDSFPCVIFFFIFLAKYFIFSFCLCSNSVKQRSSTHIHTVSSVASIKDGIAAQLPMVLPISKLFCNRASGPSSLWAFVHVTKESLSSESRVFLLAERRLWVRVGVALTASSAARCRDCSRAEWSSSLFLRRSPSRPNLVFTR